MSRYEKRHFKRYSVNGIDGRMGPALPPSGGQGGRILSFRVLDMSLTGMAIESTFPLSIGNVYGLTLVSSAPAGPTGPDDTLEMTAEATRSTLVGCRTGDAGQMENVYHIGLDFSERLGDGVSPPRSQGNSAPEILHFLQSHIVIDLDQRLPGRFRLPENPIELGLPFYFVVKKVSFSGLTIETDSGLLPRTDTIVDVAIEDDTLRLGCAARIAHVRSCDEADGGCDVGLEFQDLSIDDCLALDSFIRTVLE